VTALELLERNKRVLLLDRSTETKLGGQAITAFGGMLLVGTPLQKFSGIKDSPGLAFSDWCNTARFEDNDVLPRKWAEMYCHQSFPEIYLWLRRKGIRFVPSVMWPERGFYGQGNSVPRYHIVWGTGYGMTSTLIDQMLKHRNRDRLEMHFNHRVGNIEKSAGRVTGLSGEVEGTGESFSAEADNIVIATGGIGGDIERVRKLWPGELGGPPDEILIGSHPFCDGSGIEMAERLGGVATNLGYMWNYPEGIAHPRPEFKGQGLRVIAPRSALWMDYRGRRIGPQPLVGYYETSYAVKRICEQKKKYSWQVMNWKIAARELGLSGAEHNEAIRDRKFIQLLMNTFFGNNKLIKRITIECPDFITAGSLPELVKKMNSLAGTDDVELESMGRDIQLYDDQIERGVKFHNDDQLRRIACARNWPGDRIRMCKFQKILDPKAMPLIAVRYRIITRKSLGGIKTDLESKVVDRDGRVIAGLYAVGEAAGFGGGGINGKSSLEGTFISSCILSGRMAARSIAG